ncbi:MAG: energy transducer TonB [Agriterribacter sp.]
MKPLSTEMRMRYILMLAGIIFFYAGNAQDTTDCYFDQQLALTNKKNAAYEGKMVNTSKGWEVFVFYPGKQLLIHGYFKDKRLSEREGAYNIFFENGKPSLNTFFKNNMLEGQLLKWHNNGQVSDSGTMKQNLKTGLWKTWYASGQAESEGWFADGVPDSVWNWYHENGKPATIELYRKNKLADLTCFDTSGNKTGSNCRIDGAPCPENALSFDQFIRDNLLYPEKAARKRIEGDVSFEFIITKEGKLTRINFTNVANELLQEEVVRLLKSVPQWDPAVSHNRKVDYLYSYTVPFYLGGGGNFDE